MLHWLSLRSVNFGPTGPPSGVRPARSVELGAGSAPPSRMELKIARLLGGVDACMRHHG